ncbi:MAG: serine/threonine protein kinase [Pirellulales bacterium]|nr:serine/threonine protein kinase [Pirellulales bacterium]
MNDQSIRNPIDVLADEFVQQYRQGKRPTIEQYAQEHPEYANDIRDLFPMLVHIEQLKSHNSQYGLKQAPVQGLEIERLGDFRIVREIARGGMGIVYEAVQQSLNRRVALKVIRESAEDSENKILRFRREAEAAAKLHHTNIVPIYGVGEENHFYFYAMQMIDGVGLDVVLDVLRNSTPQTKAPMGPLSIEAAVDAASLLWEGLVPNWKTIARIGADAAAALAYAHAHGVLHRDIKPANLLLDRSGNVWITDFGLARHAEGDTLTRSGNLVGTLRYMAPEQFDGTTDHRSDIYSLGLTLHELLTLQPAFGETQQGRLIHQKTQGTAPRPRSQNPDIPRDLETIVLKACTTNPGNRYASADELAADLHRFLEERPVAARRISTAERFCRWCRRNPAIAISSGTACGLLLTTAIVAMLGNMATRTALATAKQAQSEALESQERAEKNLNLAIEAFESIFDNIAHRGIPQSLELEYDDERAPKFETVLSHADAELLRQLLTFYEHFARQNSGDRNLQAKTAAAHHRIGQIHQRLRKYEDAQSSFRDALAIFDSLLEKQPGQIDVVVQKSRLLNDYGILLSESMESPKGIAGFHLQAVSFLLDQPEDVTAARPVRFELARSHDLAGSEFFRMQFISLDIPLSNGPPGFGPPMSPPPGDGGLPPFGPPIPRKNLPSMRPPGPENPLPGLRHGRDSSRPAFPNAREFTGTGRHDEMDGPQGPREFSEYHLTQARQIVAQLLAEESENPQYRLLQAQIERHRLVHLLLSHRTADAADSFNQARTLLEKLVSDFPQEPQYRLELADTLSLASTRLASISETEAEEYLHQAIDLCQRLTAAFPNETQYQALQAASYRNLAYVQRSSQQFLEAERNLDLAKRGIEFLAARHPAQAFYDIALALVARDLADLKIARGLFEKQTESIQEAQEILIAVNARMEDRGNIQDDPFRCRIRSGLQESLSKAYQLLGDSAAAEAATKRARELSDTPFHFPFGRFRP